LLSKKPGAEHFAAGPESKIKSLRYEARLKYPPDADYIKREFLYNLKNAQFDFEKEKIVFAMEDEFLRRAIQGRLKAKGMFADSSFNSEIIRIDRDSLEAVIRELYGEKTGDDFHNGFREMEDQADEDEVRASFKEGLVKFVVDTGKSLGLALLMSRLGL
jgi:hypothetical protein